MIEQQYVPEYPLDELIEHDGNPRQHDDELLDHSLAEHGFYGAVLVQTSSRRLIAGHGRTRAARRAGRSVVPALLLDVDDVQAERLLLIDNASSDAATTDDEALAELLDRLARSTGTLDGTGFDDADLRRLLDEIEPSPIDVDDVRPLDQTAEHSCPFCGSTWVDTPDGVQLVDA